MRNPIIDEILNRTPLLKKANEVIKAISSKPDLSYEEWQKIADEILEMEFGDIVYNKVILHSVLERVLTLGKEIGYQERIEHEKTNLEKK